MKQKESDIIKFLRKGKRVNISEIARKLSLPISTVSDRIKRIEKKYIVKRASIINFEKAGYKSHVFLAIKVPEYLESSILFFLKENDKVNSMYRINSGFNFMVEAVMKNNLETIKFTKELQDMYEAEVQQFQIFNVEEKEKFVP